jgi:2-(1,2-epoxy-1,2-dihydrophenyl)acetyl-CoA isomerase
MAQQEALFEMRGGALIITFNRPNSGNAMTPDMASQIFNRLKLATTDRGVRAILLKGAGGNFMTGLDLNLYNTTDMDRALTNATQMMQPYHSIIREIQAMDKPVIAAVDGLTSGPGLSFMLACDFALAAQSAKFSGGFSAYAMTPDGGASQFLAQKAGTLRAAEILMLSEDFGAAEAEKWNLINGVVEDAKLHETALAWVDRLALGPTRAFAAIKKLLQKAFMQDLPAQLALEHANWGAASRSFDFRESLKARREKRPPKYMGG